MNCRISEFELRGVCRELLSGHPPERVSHRTLRNVLKERYGATGKTARVRKIWNEEAARVAASRREDEHRSQVSTLPTDVQALQQQLAETEARAQDLKTRAELAELRERSHQDHWALEIDRLREQLRSQVDYAHEVRALRATVARLSAELAAARAVTATR